MGNRRGGGRRARDDLISVLQLALIFAAVLVGRELGSIYNEYEEVSRLVTYFEVGEEELAGYLRQALSGGEADLDVGVAFTLPSVRNVEGQVSELPDYARRWFITATLSAIVVRQPEVSDIEVELLVEGESFAREAFPFEREKVSYMALLDRSISLPVKDVEALRRAVEEASGRYGGEVEVALTGRALAHVTWYRVWLPFSTTRYPLVRAPHLVYLSSAWKDEGGGEISGLRVGGRCYVSLRLRNLTRVHSIWENVTCTVYMEGREEAVAALRKEVAVAPGSDATYVFVFEPEGPGTYSYSLSVQGGLSLERNEAPKLDVGA